MSNHSDGRPSVTRLAALLLLIVVVGGAGWWAGRSALPPAATGPVAGSNDVAVAVRQVSVGRSLALSVTVTQPFRPVATALVTGVVTETPELATVSAGDVLYRVDNVPVRAVLGATPFFRDMAFGVRGPDVAQLQATLVTLGHLSGAPSGTFDDTTVAAVKRWQSALGQQPSGKIAAGELVALRALPTVVRLGQTVVLGAGLAGGEPTVLVRTGAASFQLIVSPQQAELIPGDATVSMQWEQTTWNAVISDVIDEEESGRVLMSLTSSDGALPCRQQCDRLPSDEKISLRAKVEIVPQTTGPAVPAAAVHTAVDGSSYVRMSDGTQRAVTVKASANGLVVVDGVTDGDEVFALGGDSNSARPSDSARSSGPPVTRNGSATPSSPPPGPTTTGG